MSSKVDLDKRLFEFSKAIIELIRDTKVTYEYKPLTRQLIRSATSVGANFEEARAGVSRADFVNKVHISTKEARESLYWLRLLDETRITTDTNALITECIEINKILFTICSKSKLKS